MTTKASEVEIKFDKVHAYLSKGEYLSCVSKSQKTVNLHGDKILEIKSA